MIIPRPTDAYHVAQLYRLLIHILDEPVLAQALHFKGGTAATMLGWLDRFSVDLDFDLSLQANPKPIKKTLEGIFKRLNFTVKDQSHQVLQFFLKYDAKAKQRNTLKLEVLPPASVHNEYSPTYLSEIDRYASCQTQPTTVANKLVAPWDRYERNHSVAGRDIYDIHHFLSQGFRYNPAIIEDRTHLSVSNYFHQLTTFIQNQVTQTVLNQDLNYLLPFQTFQKLRKTLKTEVLILLRQEIQRYS